MLFGPDHFNYSSGAKPTMQDRRRYRRRRDRRLLAQEKEAEKLQDCPNSKDDRGHCPHWWDGDGCCWCDSGPMSQEEMKQDGMIDGPTDPVAQAERVRAWQERRNKKDQRDATVRTEPGRVEGLADKSGIQSDSPED